MKSFAVRRSTSLLLNARRAFGTTATIKLP